MLFFLFSFHSINYLFANDIKTDTPRNDSNRTNCEDWLRNIIGKSEVHDQDNLSFFIKLMNDDCILVRSVAANYLGDNGVGRIDATNSLNKALNDADNQLFVFEAIFRSLAKIGNQDSVNIIVRLLNDNENNPKIFIGDALTTLASIGGKEAESFMVSFAMNKENRSFDRNVAIELIAKKGKDGVNILIPLLFNDNNSVRATVVRILGEYGGVEVIKELKKLKSDDCEAMKKLSEKAIKKIMLRTDKIEIPSRKIPEHL